MASEYLSRVEEVVINGETNDFRFERFCNAAVSHAEGGVAVTGTSTSWDMGRDGVGVGRGSGIYVCTSLRDDIDVKAVSDVERISNTTKGIKTLYFCSSQNLSEHRSDQIRAAILDLVDHKFGAVVLGAQKLAELGRLQGTILERHYGAEIRNILARIEGSSGDDQTELNGLKLALLSSGSDESVAIRNALYANAVLNVLADRAGRTATGICKEISASLGLGHSLDKSIVLPHLNKLRSEGLLEGTADVFAITEKGVAFTEQRKIAGATSLVSGRNAIRVAIETEIGSRIIDDEFNRIWNVFEGKMAEYFQARGEEIVDEVLAFVGSEDVDKASPSSSRDAATKQNLTFLENFAKSVAATSSHPQRQQELQQAIKDLFSDRAGDAAKWLVSICASFVAACTMGLEYRSSVAISSLLRRMTIVLDTDVVLSLLGISEPEHEAVSIIVERWTKMGGQVLVGVPVLEETAYHAFIADRDFEQVRTFDLAQRDVRAQLVENVFVRAFGELMARHEARMTQWRSYIDQFRGRQEYDYSTVHSYLQVEHSINRLPERSANDANFVTNVQKYILGQMEAASLRIDKNARDKALRDAELYVSLVRHAKRLRDGDPGAACILVSSARRLTGVDLRFKESGEERLVLSVSAALYLISLMPNVKLGLGSMRAFLFDETRRKFSSDLERTVLRMIYASREHSLPFAKRGILMREMRGRLLRGASYTEPGAQRSSTVDIEKEMLKSENRDELINALTESLDAVAVDTRTEKENRILKERIVELERKLDDRQKG